MGSWRNFDSGRSVTSGRALPFSVRHGACGVRLQISRRRGAKPMIPNRFWFGFDPSSALQIIELDVLFRRVGKVGSMPRFSVLRLLPLGFAALIAAVLTLPVVSAQGPQAEKRIALVIGDGAYANAPLATAANDAGLIAQTLQAAGFDVVGARDLDGDALRKSFREFMQKAAGSGPGTVAMIYLSGYGVQYAGENYFIAVDSNISRDTDIPVEGLRMSDYMRQLGTLPLKASIMVLDAARQQPFVQSSIAGGLALVEPDQHMLVAFNAAPGTVAPAEDGNYGAYAQALAEMIRTGGLPLPEVFNRVRLR